MESPRREGCSRSHSGYPPESRAPSVRSARKAGLPRTDKVVPFQIRRRLFRGLSPEQGLHGDLGRPDPDEFSPRKCPFFPVCQHRIEQMLHLCFQKRPLAGKRSSFRRLLRPCAASIAERQGDYCIIKCHFQKGLFSDFLIFSVVICIRLCQDLDVLLRIKSF